MKLFTFPLINQFAALIIVASFACANTASAQTLDQNQPTWNGGTSERNLPGYYEWQSFKAGITGQLCRIDLMFCNTNVKVNGTGTLKVYTGQGTAGTLLLTQSVTVNGLAYNFNQPFWQTWNLATSPAINANSTYTFQFIPTQSGGLTDPYLIQINIPSVYANGQNYNLGTMGDCAFRTYVISGLPVEMISFKADASYGKVKLLWSTASEINNDYFEIERSNNGVLFSTIGIVKGAGNSTKMNEYSSDDSSPERGINYYRLKQVDYDGKYSYSDVIAVTTLTTSEIVCTPNPFNSLVNIQFSSMELGSWSILVTDATGKEVKKISQLDFAAGLNNANLNLSELANGIYFCRINSGTTIHTIKLLKE